MTITAILLTLSNGIALPTQTKPVDKVMLDFSRQSFLIRKGAEQTKVPIAVSGEKPIVRLFRKNDVYAVWDSRGLSTRAGDKYRVTKYPEIAVSPRAFTREEILKTIELVKSGKRSKNASALSGAARIGSTAYFLLRWDESDGKSWAEALVRVNLESRNPEPQLVGKFSGLSLAEGPLSDTLTQIGGKLYVVTRSENSWGVASYDPKKGDFDSLRLGEGITSALNPAGDTVCAIEKAPYGANVAVRVDLLGARRRDLIEGREQLSFLDSETPELILRKQGQIRSLFNAASGASLTLHADSGVKRVGKLVLVWSPAAEPTTASLFDPERWSVVTTWSAK